jgi:transcriptional regulator with XRE-family HTH domain
MPKMDMPHAFAVVLKRNRKAQNITQEKISEAAQIHPTYVGLVERFKRNPTLDVAERLARALRLPLSKLIAEAEDLQRRGKASS